MKSWQWFKNGLSIKDFLGRFQGKRLRNCLRKWMENAKFGKFVRRKKLTFGLFVWSVWKYSAFSAPNRSFLKGKQSALLQYFQKLQIIHRWSDFRIERKRIRSVVQAITLTKTKSAFSMVLKVSLLLKEKRLARQLAEEKRKLALHQESQKLSLASHYHRQRLLLRAWKSFRLLTSHSRSIKELSILSEISLAPKSPLKTDQSKSLLSLGRGKKSPISRGNWSFEEADLTPSRERHERVTAIIANSFREKASLKRESEDSETEAIRKQLNLSLVESEPALAKAQEFLDQLNSLLASTKKSPAPSFLTDL